MLGGTDFEVVKDVSQVNLWAFFQCLRDGHMAFFRVKRHWFIGLGFVVLFLLLLALRLDLFNRGQYQLFPSRDGKAPYLSGFKDFKIKNHG